MKLVKCIIQPQKLEAVLEKLHTVAPGLTIMEVRGYGHQRGQVLLYRGIEYEANLLPKVEIDVVIDDNKVDDVIKLVVETAGTGQIGDGRIFVLPLEENVHIRTGFMDLD